RLGGVPDDVELPRLRVRHGRHLRSGTSVSRGTYASLPSERLPGLHAIYGMSEMTLFLRPHEPPRPPPGRGGVRAWAALGRGHAGGGSPGPSWTCRPRISFPNASSKPSPFEKSTISFWVNVRQSARLGSPGLSFASTLALQASSRATGHRTARPSAFSLAR